MGLFKDFFKLNFSNRIYVLFLACFWLLGYFGAFWRRVGINDNGVAIANLILLLLLSLLCRRKWSKNIHFTDIALYISLVFIYFYNSIIYPSTAQLIDKNAVQVVIGAMPFLLVGLMFKYEGNEQWISLFSRIAVIINIIYIQSSSNVDVEETMNRAYVLLPSVLYLLWAFVNHYKFIDLFFFLIGFLLECSMGSRGPFVCILFFAAVYLFFFKKYKHAYTVRSFIVIGTLFLYLFSQYIAYIMVELLSLAGKSTRIFDKMLDDSLINYEQSSGRDVIQGFLLQKLDSNNGMGFGLLADRLQGAYAHNIFVEMWYDYGYTIGSIIIAAYLLLVILLLLKSKSTSTKVLILLFFTVGFIKLQFSSSFIVDRYFFFLLGFCINGLRKVNLS